MFRRKFMESLAFAAAVAGDAKAVDTRTVTYKITGFSCLTCAIGLDTILKQTRGVIACKSTYPEAVTTIHFNPSLVTEKLLRSSISEMGFTAIEICQGTK